VKEIAPGEFRKDSSSVSHLRCMAVRGHARPLLMRSHYCKRTKEEAAYKAKANHSDNIYKPNATSWH